jgi:hypothetical protein
MTGPEKRCPEESALKHCIRGLCQLKSASASFRHSTKNSTFAINGQLLEIALLEIRSSFLKPKRLISGSARKYVKGSLLNEQPSFLTQ